MTTTAFDDQFTPSTQTIEIVHAPYEPVAILKRNVAELDLALKRQTERAEKTEAELAKLRKQEPIKYLYRVTDCFGHEHALYKKHCLESSELNSLRNNELLGN